MTVREPTREHRVSTGATRVERLLRAVFSVFMGLILMLVGVGVYAWLRYSHAEQQLHGLEIGLLIFLELLGATLVAGQMIVAAFLDTLIKLIREAIAAWKGRNPPPPIPPGGA